MSLRSIDEAPIHVPMMLKNQDICRTSCLAPLFVLRFFFSVLFLPAHRLSLSNQECLLTSEALANA